MIAPPPNRLAESRQWWSEYQAVARTINRAPSSLERLLSNPHLLPVGRSLPLGTDGTLRLDAPFERSTCGLLRGWRAHGRLIGHGPRLALFYRVDVEIVPWSMDATELRVMPRSRRAHRWGVRRLRRYWRLAHEAADHLLRILTSESPDTDRHARRRGRPV